MAYLRRASALAILAVVALLAAGCAEESGTAATPPLKLVWSDNFTGAANALPSAKNWNFVTGANGWGNNELECYTNAPGNVSTDGKGDLVITAIRQPGHVCSDGKTSDYTSARINTQGKITAKYGRMEVRAKVPTASGTWPAFWALGSDITTVQWPKAGEIDVMEVIGKQPSVVHGTLHGPKNAGGSFSTQVYRDVGTNLADSFHTYAATWGPDSITFSIDGKPYGTVSKSTIEREGGTWVFTHSFYLLLNLAVGGNYPGTPDGSTIWPQKYTIDYVKVYADND